MPTKEDGGEGLPTAAEAEICENCGLINFLFPVQNLTSPEKRPCEHKELKQIDLVKTEDVHQKQVSQHDRKEAIQHISQGHYKSAVEYLLLQDEASVEEVEGLDLEPTDLESEDVKALIQDRIDQAEEKVEKYNGLDKLNLNDAKARKQELEELLEEIEQ